MAPGIERLTDAVMAASDETDFNASGSGAAVAARTCYGALGSDTSGSIRHPDEGDRRRRLQ